MNCLISCMIWQSFILMFGALYFLRTIRTNSKTSDWMFWHSINAINDVFENPLIFWEKMMKSQQFYNLIAWYTCTVCTCIIVYIKLRLTKTNVKVICVILFVCILKLSLIIYMYFERNQRGMSQFSNLRGFGPLPLFFHEWNKSCFLFIFIISNRIQFKWKIIRGMKRGSIWKNQHYVLSWYEENLTQ